MNVIVLPVPPDSLAEKAVDVLVRDLGERGLEAGRLERFLLALRLLHDLVEHPHQLERGLLDAQADEAERGALVEDDHEDLAAADQRDEQVLLLALVEDAVELGLAEQARE